MQIDENSKFAVSNENGDYKFIGINSLINDTIILKVNYKGFRPYIKKLIITDEIMFFDAVLENDNIEYLEEVVIKANEKITHSASKSSYKINQKKFIKNSKATEVLSSIPNVYCNKESGEIIVEGNLRAKIFIDGIEAMPNEIKNLNTSTIDRVEIMNNPSSTFGTDFMGAIVNIVTKKTKQQFFKGSISGTTGVRNNYLSTNPSFVYKKGILSFKGDVSYLKNNQISTNDLTRNDNDGYYVQNFINNSKVTQNSISSRMGLNFSQKSDLTLSGYYGGYKVNGNIIGTSNLNLSNFNNYKNLDFTTNNELEISSVYKQKTGENKTLYFKKKYTITSNFYSSEYNNNDIINNYDVKSQNNELSWNLCYEIQNIKIFKKSASLLYDLKYINRNYSFINTDFYIKQDVYNGTFEVNNDWSEKLSTQTSFTYEYSSNKSDSFFKNYNILLPTLNALYHFKNKSDVSIGYSKKVLRPSPNDLNETLIIYSPGIASQGNSNLNQQIRNYHFLKFNKEINLENYSIKIYSTNINNSIVNIYKKQGDLLIRTLNNASKFNSTGIEFGYSTQLFKKIGLNIDSGLNYNVYETQDLSALIKKNNGVSFESSLYIYTNLFKDKVSVSFSGTYSNPNYSLLSKKVTYPYLDFSISTNLFKEKLGLSFYIQNLLGDDATISRDTSNSNNFHESRVSRNNFTNALLTLTYNFGKKFDDYFDDKKIENNDIRK